METKAPSPESAPRPDGAPHAGLKNLFDYPLMSAITERRTRRICRGASLDAGALSWESRNEPEPLSPLEEAILVVATTGVTGITMHDGPLQKPDGEELGTPFMNILARAASSADNCQATSFFMINDDGIWLLRQPRGEEAMALFEGLPPKWEDWTEQQWLDTADAVKVKVSDRRLDFPRTYPYYLGWNAQTSNLPGTTVLFPVVDCTWQYINGLLILLSEPDGKRPLFIDDWRTFSPETLTERLAWLGMKLGFVEDIPYHPIGGIERIRSGFVNKDNVAPLGWGHTLRTDYGAFFQFQNLMLIAQAMGLGGWIHGAVFNPYIFEHDPEKKWYGLGFRMEPPKKKWRRRWPPVPASQPNPVGIDGILEGLCPPYVSSMDEAVDKVVAMKSDPKGFSYGNREIFARSYKKPEHAEAYLKQARHFSPEAIAYTKEICNYIYDTYGRFPAHVEAFYTPGVWLQVANLELEYYEKYYASSLYERQARHDELWGTA